jgi:hypothetical protein
MQEMNGFDFIINRLANLPEDEVQSPLPVEIHSAVVPEVPSSEESSDNNEGTTNLMKFVGRSLGMSLVKQSKSTKLPS